jgi:2',3'-cyclic-nucleotide 2'-phosphodiesterase (5'-nucleotidase family)
VHFPTHKRLAGLLAAAWLTAAPAPAPAREVPITILHTTDLHGHLFPVTDYDKNEDVGGLLRCATLIEQRRAAKPGALLVDCGDSFQGGAESFLTGGRMTVQAMEWLRYDAWVLGNHEFDWGLDALKKLHDETTLPMLGANVGVRRGQKQPLDKVRPFLIREVDGVRVALVGLNTPGIPSWSRPELLGPMEFDGSVRALARVMPAVRAEHPDVLVLLVHQGYRAYGDNHANEINQIVRKFPEFDVIIGGHTHVVMPEVRLKNTLYTQAGYHGNWLGEVDLVFDTVAGRVVRKQSVVHRVGREYPDHPELRARLEPDLQKALKYLDTPVGRAETELKASLRAPGQSPVQQLLARAIAARSGADVVLHGVLEDETLVAGPIAMRDVWRIVPYENRIGIAELNLREIKEILEENVSNLNSIHFLGIYGMHYELWPDAPPGRRVANLRLPDGSIPHPKKRFKVAMNSYALASGGQRCPLLRKIAERPTSRLKLLEADTRQAVVDYIRAHSPLRIEPGREVTIHRPSPRSQSGS